MAKKIDKNVIRFELDEGADKTVEQLKEMNKLKGEYTRQQEVLNRLQEEYSDRIAAMRETNKRLLEEAKVAVLQIKKDIPKMEDSKYILPNFSKVLILSTEINKMNKESATLVKDISDERIKQIDKEIAGMQDQARNITVLNKAYRDKEQLLTTQSEAAKQKVEEEFKEKKGKGADLVILEQWKADKIREINQKLGEDLHKNSKEWKKAIEKSLEPAKDAKGIVDIDATKQNIQQAVDGLKAYKTSVLITQNEVINSYNLQIEAAKGDEKKVAELTKKKEETIKKHREEVKKVEKQITETQDKENGLRLKQWESYAAKVEKTIGDVKKHADNTISYLSSATGALSGIYKAEIANYDEQKAHIKEKKDAIETEYKNITAEITAKQTEKENLEKENSKDDITDTKKKDNEDKIAILNAEVEATKNANKGLLDSYKHYTDKTAELDKKTKKKKAQQEKINKITRKVEMTKQMVEATVSVAQGVTKALAFGPFIGPILAALVAAAGAVQIGIMAKQIAKFEDGGLLQGKRHTQGGMRIEGSNIEVEGGEYVVNRESTHRNIDLIRYINSQRRELSADDIHSFYASARQTPELPFRRMFADGGELPVINNTVNVDNEMLVKAIRDIRIEPKVAVTDIHRAQEKMVDVSGWSTV